MYNVGKTVRDRSDRLLSPVRPIGSPVALTGPTDPYSHAAPNQHDVSTSTQPNSSSNFDKTIAENKNNLVNLLRENLGVDVTGKTRAYKKQYPTSFDSVSYPARFRLPEFV